MKRTITLCLAALMLLLQCRFERVEARYGVQIQFNNPINLSVFQGPPFYNLYFTLPEEGKILQKFVINDLAGSLNTEFIINGARQYDAYDAHLVYLTPFDYLYETITFVNVPNGSPIFFEPERPSSSLPRQFRIAFSTPIDSVVTLGRYKPYSQKSTDKYLSFNVYHVPNSDLIVGIKTKQSNGFLYYLVPNEKMSGTQPILLDATQFSKWTTKGQIALPPSLSESTTLRLSGVTNNESQIADLLFSYTPVGSGSSLQTGFLLPPAPAFEKYMLEFSSPTYDLNCFMDAQKPLVLEVPENPIKSASIHGDLLTVEVGENVDWLKVEVVKDRIKHFVYGRPADLRQYRIPNFDLDQVKANDAPTVEKVTAYRSALHGAEEMQNGFPFRDSGLTAKARSRLEVFKKSF